MKANRSQSTDPWAGLNHNQRCLLPVASAAVSTAMASTVTTATFRRGMFCGRQRGRQDHDGDRNIEL